MIASLTRFGGGKTKVVITCDECRDDLQNIEILVLGGNNSAGNAGKATVASKSELNAKITAQGWRVSSGKKHTCVACINAAREAKPKKEKPDMMATPAVEAPRQPTREQKREIMAMLELSYDTKAQRYKGADTDKTIAATIGPQILWGWVAQLREEFFGPEANEAAEHLMAEAREWMKTADALSAKVHDQHNALIASLREFNEAKAKVADLVNRLATASRPRGVPAK